MVNRPDTNKARLKRHKRVRAKVSGTAACPRLDVFRSLQHIYAQLIDDVAGVTLVSASTTEKEGSEAATRKAKPYAPQETGGSSMAADPIVQYMSREQLEKSIQRTRKLMQEAAKKLDFIEAAQYRDEVLRLEDELRKKA